MHEAPLPAPWVTGDGVRVYTGVPYAAVPGVRPVELDLYTPPDSRASSPVVIFLHGGGWCLGSRRSLGPAYAEMAPSPFERAAAAGIAVASVDYRLSGEAIWPAQLHDAKAAVRWLRRRGGEAGLDPDRIAAWGESAGAHLALLLGLTGSDLDGEIGYRGASSAVEAVVSWYAPSDLVSLPADLGADPLADGTREAQLLGSAIGAIPDIARQASPVCHVHPGAPPVLLLHGAADQLIPAVQSERLAARLRGAGTDVRLTVYPGADHMWRGSTPARDDALVSTLEFLSEQLVG